MNPSPDGVRDRPLAELVHTSLQAVAHSPHTRRAYRTALGLFLQFLDRERGQGLPAEWRPLASATADGRRTNWTYRGPAGIVGLVDARLVEGFRAWREAEGDSANAALARWAAVRSFLSVAYLQGILPADQARVMGLKALRPRRPRPPQPAGRRLSTEEVHRLLAAVPADTPKGHRDRALLEAMLYLGLRPDEVASLRLSDFREQDGSWWVHVSGPRGQQRRMKVHEALLTSLSAWLAAAGRALGGEGPVFMSLTKGGRVTGRPLHLGMVGRLVAEYGQAAGLALISGPGRLSPHDLRRTCARTAYDHGANLLLVQALLGHSDPRTTAQYIGVSAVNSDTAVDYVQY